jgi:REP-associated tyrosine transposase
MSLVSAPEGRQSLAGGETPGGKWHVFLSSKPWKGDSAIPGARATEMPQSFACLHYHFIFSTKNRQPFITPDLEPRLFEYIGGTLRANKSVLLAAGGMRDHLHLLVGLSKELSVSEVMRIVKAESSKWIHEKIAGLDLFAWQAGYGAFTVSYSNINAVKLYFANQKDHHRTTTFKEEFVEFLVRHEIDYDEGYLWE